MLNANLLYDKDKFYYKFNLDSCSNLLSNLLLNIIILIYNYVNTLFTNILQIVICLYMCNN